MTPEERAERIADQLFRLANISGIGSYAQMPGETLDEAKAFHAERDKRAIDIIAAAIREARIEALEEAANKTREIVRNNLDGNPAKWLSPDDAYASILALKDTTHSE